MLHSPTIPHFLADFRERDRSMWYSRFVIVCDGATTMLSPVCTLMLRTFSMLQTIWPLSSASRITSYSICFQCPMYSSMRTWCAMLRLSPLWTICSSSFSFLATPPPLPPSVYATLIITG